MAFGLGFTSNKDTLWGQAVGLTEARESRRNAARKADDERVRIAGRLAGVQEGQLDIDKMLAPFRRDFLGAQTFQTNQLGKQVAQGIAGNNPLSSDQILALFGFADTDGIKAMDNPSFGNSKTPLSFGSGVFGNIPRLSFG